jgi:hypothetical protein
MYKKSKQVGRPKVPMCDRRRNIIKSVLNDADYDELLRMSDIHQLSISDIIRMGIDRLKKEMNRI